MPINLAPEGAKRTRESLYSELIELVDGLTYDVGKLPYQIMRDEPNGRALFDSYERLSLFLRAHRQRLTEHHPNKSA